MKIIREKEFCEETGRTLSHAIGLCDCGTEVQLGSFTCTCDGCGADYNWNGTLLASREQWGEETGESLADIEGPMTREEQDDLMRFEEERQHP